MLLGALGVVAYGLPLALASFGLDRFRARPVALRAGRLAAIAVLVSSFGGLITLAAGDIIYFSSAQASESFRVPAGGMLGHLVAAVARRFLGRAGGFIVLASLVAASLVFTSRFSVGRLVLGAWTSAGQLASRLDPALIRWWDRRRKTSARRRGWPGPAPISSPTSSR